VQGGWARIDVTIKLAIKYKYSHGCSLLQNGLARDYNLLTCKVRCRGYKCDNKHETNPVVAPSRTMVGRSENRDWGKLFFPSPLVGEAGTHLVGYSIRYNSYHRNCEMTHQRESTQGFVLKRKMEAAWCAFAAGGYHSRTRNDTTG